MKKSTEFSFILPIHKVHRYLDGAILSVLAQNYINYEVILIANGMSLEDYNFLVNKYRAKNVKVIYSSLPSLPHALNVGIESARFEYIVRMDSDDLCMPNRLEIMDECIRLNPDVDLWACSYYKINENDVLINGAEKSGIGFTDVSIRWKLALRCVIAHPTVCFKKSSVVKLGGYSFGSHSEDYDLWLRMVRSKNAVLRYVEFPVIKYRVHSEQATSLSKTWNILSCDLSLKVRELFITGKLVYLLGILYSLMYHVYKKLILDLK